MATTQPLAIQCRDPGEFISSIIEHHRAGGGGGVQQPLKDREKTYLIFVGIEDENGVFEMMDDDREYIPLSGEEGLEMPWSESDGSEQRLPGEPPGSGQRQMTQSQTPELGQVGEDTLPGNVDMDEGRQVEEPNHGVAGPDQGFQSANDQKSPISKAIETKTPKHGSPPALPEEAEAVSPVQLLPVLPSSSPLSSPPPEEDDEALFMTGESVIASKGQEGSQSPGTKAQGGLDKHSAGRKELHKETGAQSEATNRNKDTSRATEEANIPIPETPNTRRKVLLQIREPSSPIPPQPHETPPLTTPGAKRPVSQPYQSSQAVPKSSMITSPTAKRLSIPTKGSNTAQSQRSEEKEEEEEYTTYPTPTLEILSAAEHVELLYLRDLGALRTFLTLLQYSPSDPEPASNPPLLAIWGLIGAHHTTGEFSGESIANTLSLAVDAAAESGRFLVLGEGYVQEDMEGGEVPWMEAEVPVLRGGAGTGRTVVVKRVLGRWCRFVEELE